MAHWAELDDDGVVLRVIVCDADLIDPEDPESGESLDPPPFLTDVLGGTWQRTYYATKGQTYAGIGYSWDGKAFAPPEAPPFAAEIEKAIGLLEARSVLTTAEADKARQAAQSGADEVPA